MLHVTILVLLCPICYASGKDCEDLELTGSRGVITSPNYPNEYPHNANCKWTITAPKGRLVRLSFTKFDIEDPFFSCTEDFVTVWLDEKTSQIFCNGNNPQGFIYSTTNVLEVRMKSDSFYVNGAGFRAEYDIVTEDGEPVADERPEDEDGDGLEEDDQIEEKDDYNWDWDDTDLKTTISVTPEAKTDLLTSTNFEKVLKSNPAVVKGEKKDGDDITEAPNAVDNRDGSSKEPGASSGAVLAGVIGSVFLVFGILFIGLFFDWRRKINKRRFKRKDNSDHEKVKYHNCEDSRSGTVGI